MQRDQRDRLAQSHVVGQTAAETERGHGVQPVQAAQLVVAQTRVERGRLSDRTAVPRLRVGDPLPQLLQPAGRRHLHPVPVDVRGPGQHGPQRVDRGDLVVLGPPGPAGVLRVDEHPLVAQPDQGPARLRELVELRPAQRRATQREPPVERQQCVGRQERRRVRSGAPGRSGVVVLRADHRPRGELPRAALWASAPGHPSQRAPWPQGPAARRSPRRPARPRPGQRPTAGERAAARPARRAAGRAGRPCGRAGRTVTRRGSGRPTHPPRRRRQRGPGRCGSAGPPGTTAGGPNRPRSPRRPRHGVPRPRPAGRAVRPRRDRPPHRRPRTAVRAGAGGPVRRTPVCR